jgi:hypothetical protein
MFNSHLRLGSADLSASDFRLMHVVEAHGQRTRMDLYANGAADEIASAISSMP